MIKFHIDPLCARSKELAGLSKKAVILKLETILAELGITGVFLFFSSIYHPLIFGAEGRPTIEKCKEIRQARELEQELREIDTGNILSTRKRRGASGADVSSGEAPEVVTASRKRAIHAESDETSESESEIDLSKLGDPDAD